MTTSVSILHRGMRQRRHVHWCSKNQYRRQVFFYAGLPMPAGRCPSQLSMRRQAATLAPVQRPSVLSISSRA
jgi:hypothetical protein